MYHLFWLDARRGQRILRRPLVSILLKQSHLRLVCRQTAACELIGDEHFQRTTAAADERQQRLAPQVHHAAQLFQRLDTLPDAERQQHQSRITRLLLAPGRQNPWQSFSSQSPCYHTTAIRVRHPQSSHSLNRPKVLSVPRPFDYLTDFYVFTTPFLTIGVLHQYRVTLFHALYLLFIICCVVSKNCAINICHKHDCQCDTLVTPVTPLKTGCTPTIHKHCYTRTPYFEAFCSTNTHNKLTWTFPRVNWRFP